MNKVLLGSIVMLMTSCVLGLTSDEFVALKKRADSGDAASMCEIGRCYRLGDGVVADPALASEWVKKAAAQGLLRAKGVCLQFGYGESIDMAKAVELYRSAAEQGDVIAMRDLGMCYEFGKGVEKDARLAYKWYTKALKSSNGVAWCDLGRLVELGKVGSAPKMNNAVVNYRMAAKKGSVNAKDLLLVLCGNEKKMKDPNLALTQYRAAAEKGNSIAMFALGNRYKEGVDVERDETRATEWYRKAIRAGLSADCKEIALYSMEEIDGLARAVEMSAERAKTLKKDAKKRVNETLVMKSFWLGMMKEDAVTLCKYYLGQVRGTEVAKLSGFDNGCLVEITFSRSDVDKMFSVSGVSGEAFAKKLIEAYPIIGEFEVSMEEVPDTERQVETKKSIETRWKARALNAGGGFDTGYNMAIEARAEYDRVKDSITKSAKVYRCENKKGFLLEIHEGLPDSFLSLKKIGVVKDSNFD